MSVIVRAEHLALETGRGSVYGPVSFQSSAPLTLVAGPPGSGKSSLLLTLAGRMRASSGRLEVLGVPATGSLRRVQRRTGIAGFHGIDDPEEVATVAQAIAERAAWLAPWYRRTPRIGAAEVREVCAPVFGEPGAAGSVPIPAASTLIRDLSELQTALLLVTLAAQAGPGLIACDGIDRIQSDADRATAWRRLATLARRGTAVAVSVADVHPELLDGLGVAWTAIDLAQTEPAAAGPRAATADRGSHGAPETVSLESLLEA